MLYRVDIICYTDHSTLVSLAWLLPQDDVLSDTISTLMTGVFQQHSNGEINLFDKYIILIIN